jgi:hypothetical protein
MLIAQKRFEHSINLLANSTYEQCCATHLLRSNRSQATVNYSERVFRSVPDPLSLPWNRLSENPSTRAKLTICYRATDPQNG